ncbi:MAG: tetratricopeptide repeat protein [Candidatus Poribacteria bacterium]|nr:tetratricopeptide repeat protein [Candidatus Poribacteria bacterium]MDE0503581.1 tetratricopeptide repeat protein [Candidatus Poribacteria bacterium]
MIHSILYSSIKKQRSAWCLRLILIGIIGLYCPTATQARDEVDLIKNLADAKQDVEANPASLEAHLNLGFAYMELGSMHRAEVAFETVIRLDPYAPSGHYWLGGVYFLQAKYEKSIDVFKRSLEKLPDWSAAHHALGMSYFERHNHEAAEIAFSKALALMQKSDSPRYEVPRSSFRSRGYGWSIKLSPANTFYFLGLIASHRGRLDRAVTFWRQAIEVGPPLAEVYFELGVAHNKAGKWKDSVHALREAIRLRPEMPAAHYQLARAYLKQGRTSEGNTELEEFKRLKTSYDQLNAQHTMIRQAPDAAITLFRLARRFMRQRKYVEASREFQKALWHDPNLVEAHSGLGHAYFGLGRLDDALKAQQKAIELQPDMAEAHVAKGLILLQRAEKSEAKADYERAISAFRKGIELNSKLEIPILVRASLGRIYLQEGKLKEASHQFEEILKVDPNSGDAHYYLGTLHVRRRNYEKAEESYGHAIKLDPTSAKAYERLAHLYGSRGIRRNTAVRLAQKAVELQPDSAACFNTLSWLHYLNKDFEKAEAAVKKALALQPNNQLYSEGLTVIQQARLAEDDGK